MYVQVVQYVVYFVWILGNDSKDIIIRTLIVP